jgi:hypothetical protein
MHISIIHRSRYTHARHAFRRVHLPAARNVTRRQPTHMRHPTPPRRIASNQPSPMTSCACKHAHELHMGASAARTVFHCRSRAAHSETCALTTRAMGCAPPSRRQAAAGSGRQLRHPLRLARKLKSHSANAVNPTPLGSATPNPQHHSPVWEPSTAPCDTLHCSSQAQARSGAVRACTYSPACSFVYHRCALAACEDLTSMPPSPLVEQHPP